MSLGKQLKAARAAKNLTQEEAARRLGITFQALSNYERDYRHPDTTLLVKLAELYGVTTDYLLGRTDSGRESLGEDPTDEELEEFLRHSKVKFDGAPLDEEDKEDIINFLKLVWKRKKA